MMRKIDWIYTEDDAYKVDNLRDGRDFNEYSVFISEETGLELIAFYSFTHRAVVAIPSNKITAFVFEPEEEETND